MIRWKMSATIQNRDAGISTGRNPRRKRGRAHQQQALSMEHPPVEIGVAFARAKVLVSIATTFKMLGSRRARCFDGSACTGTDRF